MAANSVYDPTIIAIEIIQSLQSGQAPAKTPAAGDQPAQTDPANASNTPNQPGQVSGSQGVNGESVSTGPALDSAAPINSVQAPQAAQAASSNAAVATTTASPQMSPDSYSPMSDIGPFGWVGIGFLFCLLFALIINIYLKKQKREMDEPIAKEELEKFAPGAMEEQA